MHSAFRTSIFAELLCSPSRLVTLSAMVFIGSISSSVADPLFLKWMIDSLLQRDVRTFAVSMAVMIVVSLFTRMTAYRKELFLQNAKNEALTNISATLLTSFLANSRTRSPLKDSAYSASRIYDEPKQTVMIFDIYAKALGGAFSFIGATIVCLHLSPRLAFALAGIVPIVYYATRYFSQKIMLIAAERNEAEANFRGLLVRIVGAVKDIKIFSLQGLAMKIGTKTLGRVKSDSFRLVRGTAKLQLSSGLSLSAAELIIMALVGIRVASGVMTVGAMMAFVSAYWRVVNSATLFLDLAPDYALAIAGHSRTVSFMDECTDYAPKSVTVTKDIKFSSVDFSYGTSEVLTRVSFNIKHRTKLLLRGGNGTGKTTLLNLMCGFLRPDNGEIAAPPLSGISASLSPESYVPGTLREQLMLVGEDRSSLATSILLSQVLGLDDKMDVEFVAMSLGQKKKAHILLTIAKDADIYIFDEPLAGIDSKTKHLVMDAIFAKCRDKTLIVVLHGDTSYNDRFDRIVDIETLLEEGSFQKQDGDLEEPKLLAQSVG